MDWLRENNWFAVRSKRFRESLAAASVSALDLEVFLPKIKVDRPECQIIKREAKPLFPGYFFCRFTPMLALEFVESARGVSGVVKSGGWPIPVEHEIVREIQERVELDGLIRLRRPGLSPGDRVCIQVGPLEGMMARVETELDDGKRVAVLLEALWNARVLIETRSVELEPA
jgi:transcriptional antiterminator RfaH